MYALLRSLLFQLPPEVAHRVSLSGLKLAARLPFCSSQVPIWAVQPVQRMGLTFPNNVGLAAGLDKNGDYVDALGRLGFGFIEVGTVTPRAQPGNSKPRLFRLPKAQALINRMGFNNAGVDHLIAQIRSRSYNGVLGVNIGKNIDTPVDNALEDYLIGLRKAYPIADYISVNISSPNTPGLRDLQQTERLENLISRLKEEQGILAEQMSRYVPLVVKIAPDLDDNEIKDMADTFNRLHIDGLIATNTTSSRRGVEGLVHAQERGGLSGRPVFVQSTEVLRKFRKALDPDIVLIAAGGIFSHADMLAKLDAGAELIQVYTGLIYQGPGMIKALLSGGYQKQQE